ncbi:MAG: TerB family tellurite resistance protein [Crocinitomicaceae bacterium]|nr:TerB family tellurite resistance protein [Crocinitomicaceae bacterium]MBK9593043.1 TerB family tellurite resistance protein [Crocinitomicaceae bacterium]
MEIEELYESGERKVDRSHFRNLVMIAKADGPMGIEEKNLLNKIGAHIGLSPEQIERIIKNPKQFSSNTPYNREERFEQMINLIQMAQIDGNISDKEMKVLEHVAVGIGFKSLDDVDVESILALIGRGEGTDGIMDELLY